MTNAKKIAILAFLACLAGCSESTPPTNAEIIKALDALNGGVVNVPDSVTCTEVGHGKTDGLPFWDMDCKGFGGPRDSQVIRAVRHVNGSLEAYAA